MNLYRYTNETRVDFFKAIDKIKDRIWLPYQAGYEFHKNRFNVIESDLFAYEDIINKMDSSIKKLNSELEQYTRHSSIDIKKINQRFNSLTKEIKDHLNSLKSKHPDYYKNDEILDKLTNVFDGKTGDSFDETVLNTIYSEGSNRYKNLIPPGYADEKNKEKEGNQSLYGDLIIWKELINLTKQKQMPMIFITDDRKEDWWFRFKGKTIGPRFDLIAEFFKETNIRLLIYQADSFLRYAQVHFVKEIKQKSIQETRLIRESDESDYAKKIGSKLAYLDVIRANDENTRIKLLEYIEDNEDKEKFKKDLFYSLKLKDLYRKNPTIAKIYERKLIVDFIQELIKNVNLNKLNDGNFDPIQENND